MSVVINGDTGISGVNGHSGTPALKGGDNDTGIFFGSDTAAVSTAGSQRLVVQANGDVNIDSGGVVYDASSNYLGIGTTDIEAPLHIGAVDSWLDVGAQSGNRAKLGFNSNDVFFGNSSSTGDFIWVRSLTRSGNPWTGGSEIMRTDSGGRLLIGESSSAYASTKLLVAGVNSGNYVTLLNTTKSNVDGFRYSYIHFRGRQDNASETESTLARVGAAHDGEGDDQKGRLVFSTNDGNDTNSPVERMRINSSGFVGISRYGTSLALADPTAPLHIRQTSTYSDGSESIVFQKYSHRSTADLGTQTSFIEFDFTDGNLNEIPQVKFGAQLGTNTEADSQIKEGSGAFIVFTNNSTTSGDPDTTPTGMAERLRVDYLGRLFVPAVHSTTTASGSNVNVGSDGLLRRSTSSIKYKKDVETLEDNYADAVLGCRPVWYRSTSNGDNPNHGWWGFIAEEVAEIDPRLVHYKTTERVITDDGLAEFAPCDPVPEAVAYERFVPHLLNLLQRQKSAIEALEQRLSDAGIA